MKKLSFILLAVASFFYMHVALSAALPIFGSAVPGGIAVVEIPITTHSIPYASFQDHRLMVLKHKQHWYAVTGIPLSVKPGVYSIAWQVDKSKVMQQPFTIRAKAYPKQYLTIKDRRKVSPNQLDLKRIQQEQLKINQIKDTWNKSIEPTLHFTWPVKGRISSEFGLQRFYNSQPRSPHAGLDIAAPAGTLIKAPADGKVLATGNFFFSGNTIYLDHGQGFITMYGHLSEIDVKPGQVIRQGQALGKVGQTGRATGPHLHWGVMLNTFYINPRLLLKEKR